MMELLVYMIIIALRVAGFDVDAIKLGIPKHTIPGKRRKRQTYLAVGLLALPPVGQYTKDELGICLVLGPLYWQ